jgi:hypothetical protein
VKTVSAISDIAEPWLDRKEETMRKDRVHADENIPFEEAVPHDHILVYYCPWCVRSDEWRNLLNLADHINGRHRNVMSDKELDGLQTYLIQQQELQPGE